MILWFLRRFEYVRRLEDFCDYYAEQSSVDGKVGDLAPGLTLLRDQGRREKEGLPKWLVAMIRNDRLE